MGFDGSTGVRENEYVTTFAEKAVKRECARGGKTGGLGYIAILPRVVELPCPSAPCDIDPSRQRGNPAKVYYGITVEFPFETPMVPQGQVGHTKTVAHRLRDKCIRGALTAPRFLRPTLHFGRRGIGVLGGRCWWLIICSGSVWRAQVRMESGLDGIRMPRESVWRLHVLDEALSE